MVAAGEAGSSFWAHGWQDLTAPAWSDCELSGGNPVSGVCALTASGVLVRSRNRVALHVGEEFAAAWCWSLSPQPVPLPAGGGSPALS